MITGTPLRITRASAVNSGGGDRDDSFVLLEVS
jgi:hypothetical protein